MGNLEPHHQELAMDPGRAPLRVFLAHPLNEITHATREGSSSMMNTTGCSSGVSVCVRDGLDSRQVMNASACEIEST